MLLINFRDLTSTGLALQIGSCFISLSATNLRLHLLHETNCVLKCSHAAFISLALLYFPKFRMVCINANELLTAINLLLPEFVFLLLHFVLHLSSCRVNEVVLYFLPHEAQSKNIDFICSVISQLSFNGCLLMFALQLRS